MQSTEERAPDLLWEGCVAKCAAAVCGVGGAVWHDAGGAASGHRQQQARPPTGRRRTSPGDGTQVQEPPRARELY